MNKQNQQRGESYGNGTVINVKKQQKELAALCLGFVGKTPELSALMDTFIYSLIGLSSLALEVKKVNNRNRSVRFICDRGVIWQRLQMLTLMKMNLFLVF